MLLHPRQRDAERPGELADGGAARAQALEHAAARRVGERGERAVELLIVNHMVHYSGATM